MEPAKFVLRGISPHGRWQLNEAGGYDVPAILERVRMVSLKVKRGEAVFERDSVCFYHEEYRWATLACLLRVGAENGGVLRVLDFVGSLMVQWMLFSSPAYYNILNSLINSWST